MDDIKKELIHTEDGRLADRIVQEFVDNSTGEQKIVTELHVEPKVQKNLTQRIIEVKKPVVVRREIETVDELTGNVTERRIETVTPDPRLELREHIQASATVNSLNVKDDRDCYVTQDQMQNTLEEMKEGILAVAKALTIPSSSTNNVVAQANSNGKVSMKSIVADKVEASEKWDMQTWGLLSIAAALAGTLLWMILG